MATAAYFGTAYWLEASYPVPMQSDAGPNVAGKKSRLYGPFAHPAENPFSYAIERPFLFEGAIHPNGDSTSSALQLYENDTRLGPADSTLKDIAFVGLGRFLHWEEKGTLIFSTSDNSDPNTNGRAYWIVKP